MSSARSKLTSGRQQFSNKPRTLVAGSSSKTTVRGGGGSQQTLATSTAVGFSSSMAAMHFAPENDESSVVLSARRANQQYLLEQQQKSQRHENASNASKNSSLAEEDERRFSALSPKSTTSISAAGSTVFPDTPENNKENHGTSTPGKSISTTAAGSVFKVQQHQLSDQSLLSPEEEQGSPEESCWLVRKEEIAEARSASKQVLTRMPSMHHPLNSSSKLGGGESQGRRSTRSASTPIQPLVFEDATTANKPQQQLQQKEGGTQLRYSQSQEPSQQRRSVSAAPLTPTDMSSIFPSSSATIASSPSALSMLGSSPSPAATNSSSGTGAALVEGKNNTTTTSVSPLPKAPTTSGSKEAPKAIVFAAYENKQQQQQTTLAAQASSSFTATRVNAAARRSQHGVVVGTPKPEEQMQRKSSSISSSPLVAVDAKPTAASLEKKLEALEVVKESLNSNSSGGTFASPVPSSPPTVTTTTSPAAQNLPSTPVRLLSEDTVIAPSYLSGPQPTEAAAPLALHGNHGINNTTTEGTQTAVLSSISSGIQVDLQLPTKVEEEEEEEEDIKTFEDKCCGGDEPLPSISTGAEEDESKAEKDALKPIATSCSISIQTVGEETVPTTSDVTASTIPRARSTDPFENYQPRRGEAKAEGGCCVVM